MARTIPSKDTDFNETQSVITTKTKPNVDAWQIDRTWYSENVISHQLIWEESWAAYLDPNTRTKLITFNKNLARKNYEPSLAKLIGILKSNPFVTPSDLAEMGIATGKGGGGGRNPAPDTYPDYDVDTSIMRRLGIHFFNHGSKSHAKPHGIHGAEIKWAKLAVPPVDVEELLNSSFDTRSPFTLDFLESERGETVWFCLRWENTTGEKGPWSELIKAIIP
ncbi:MAG: hypothetical protein LBJ17_06345 [Dysgonamonadaceae bacterium]|jgi:hypothetical protein|nr:hypothetical protein [Dysgonamonadaceae bacterium]